MVLQVFIFAWHFFSSFVVLVVSQSVWGSLCLVYSIQKRQFCILLVCVSRNQTASDGEKNNITALKRTNAAIIAREKKSSKTTKLICGFVCCFCCCCLVMCWMLLYTSFLSDDFHVKNHQHTIFSVNRNRISVNSADSPSTRCAA